MQPYIPFDGHTKYFRKSADATSVTIDNQVGIIGKIGFSNIALIMAVMFGSFVIFLEIVFPWQDASERPKSLSLQPATADPFTTPAGWPPGAAGACIGFLQIPGVLLLNKALGSSSAYVTAVAQCCPDSVCEKGKLDLIKSKRGGYWQLAYIIGAILGGYFAAMPVNQKAEGPTVPVAIVGGIILLFGSRMGQGCTSGHGISGFSMLGTHSVIATCTMFGGGTLPLVLH